MAQEQTEDGGLVAKKNPCSYRRAVIGLIFLCTFLGLYGLNLMDTNSAWKVQLWSHYFSNSSSKSRPSNRSAHSPLHELFQSLTEQRASTKMATTVETTSPPPPPLPPPPEYKSPGLYLVEYPYKYNFIINEPKRCEELKPFVVLMVPVAPQNKAARHAIRDTWGAQKVVSGKNIAVFFLLGLGKADKHELLAESAQHRDIIQSDFVDCYKNLTIKTMVMLEWLDANCGNAAYAMKIDSDMFLNVPRLMQMLEDAPKTNYLTGLVEWSAGVHRHTTSKWYVPFDVFAGSTYPPYALGLGYVLSRDLARRLVEASREVKALYIEDVYLGMCMKRLGLHPTEPPFRGAFFVWPPPYSRCQYSNLVATTLSERQSLRTLWRDFTTPGPPCGNKS